MKALVLCIWSLCLFGQMEGQSFTIHFKHIHQELPLKEESKSTISTFKYYISDVLCVDENGIHFPAVPNTFLIDKHTKTIRFNRPTVTNIEYVKFKIGIDSTTNYRGALDGALDPIHGMYWSWQNGYINMKLEGNNFFEDGTKKDFAFHLGGFRSGASDVAMRFDANDNQLNLVVDLDHFLYQVKQKGISKLMSPGSDACELMKLFAFSFSSK